jgi:hypothetical protein
MRVTAIGGAPCAGKTTFMKALIRSLPLSVLRKIGTVVFHEWLDERIIVLGDYTKAGKFKGTDRLSMSVQPQVLGFLKQLASQETERKPIKEWRVLFEGARLFNASFLTECEKFAEVDVLVLNTLRELLENRHIERWDKQTEKWLNAMESQVDSVAAVFCADFEAHDIPRDTDRIVRLFLKRLGVAANSPQQ